MRGLQRAGYRATGVGTGRGAPHHVPPPDVILLDLGLPDMDGVDVHRELRRRSDASIIVATACGEESDRVAALDDGADDYPVKPFGLAELLARMKAVLRRVRPSGPELLTHGPLVVDPAPAR
jgi:DNA-binding response OmpR family regulator